ncbi:MAG: hypothetical protein AB1498_04465 [bacterium]
MFNFIKKYKKAFIIGIIFLFGTASGFAYVKTCCGMEKNEENHSCCSKKASFNYKNTSKCECKISIPLDFVFENKSNAANSLLKQFVSFVQNRRYVNVLSENNDILHSGEFLFKSCSIPIFLKDCSFLI